MYTNLYIHYSSSISFHPLLNSLQFFSFENLSCFFAVISQKLAAFTFHMLLANVYYFYSPSLYLLHYSTSKTNYKLLNLLFCIYLVGARPGVGVYFSLTLTHNSSEKISSIVYLLLCHFFTFVHSYNPPHTTYSSFGPSQMSILTTFPFTPNVVFLPFFSEPFCCFQFTFVFILSLQTWQKKIPVSLPITTLQYSCVWSLRQWDLQKWAHVSFGLIWEYTITSLNRNPLFLLLGSLRNLPSAPILQT